MPTDSNLSCCNSNDGVHNLIEGIRGFQDRFYRMEPDRMQDLVENGQHPKTLLIACSDSRVDPAILTGAAPGELFVIRNVANLVPPHQQAGSYDGARAAIEYAVRDLGVSHIVILGHAHCGGIKALLGTLAGSPLDREFIGGWVSIALDASVKYILNPGGAEAGPEESADTSRPALDTLRENPGLAERAAIRGSLDNLKTYPWIRSRLDDGSLKLHGWWFDLETGDLWCTDEANTSFLPDLG